MDEQTEVAQEAAGEAAAAVVIAEKAVEEKVAAVEENAAAMVASAAGRAAEAEAMAQAVMDASVFTELGKRVESIERDCARWQSQTEAMQTELSLMKATLTDLSARMPPVVIAGDGEAPKGSPIPASPKTEIVIPENPEGNGDGQKGGETLPPKRRRAVL